MRPAERALTNFGYIKPDGKLMGGAESKQLRDQILDFIANGELQIIIDFSNVRWLNSLCIGMLLFCLRKIKERGGNLYLVALSKQVAFYLEVTQLDTVFNLYPGPNAVLQEISRKNKPGTGGRHSNIERRLLMNTIS